MKREGAKIGINKRLAHVLRKSTKHHTATKGLAVLQTNLLQRGKRFWACSAALSWVLPTAFGFECVDKFLQKP